MGKGGKSVGKGYSASFPKKDKTPKIDAETLEKASAVSPVWCWDWMDDGLDGFHWSGITFDDLKQLLAKLEQYRQFKRHELMQADCHLTDWIIEPAIQRLKDTDRYDLYDTLWSFRISGTKRIWALWHGSRAYILWFDPNHKIRPTDLQNRSEGKKR